jgi:very-short-patch-repair endonuclease
VFDDQSGVVTRAQALASGLTIEAIRAHVRAGRWQPLFRSTYATFSGPVPRECVLWSAVLCAGAGAALSHQSAAEVSGLVDIPHTPIHVVVPSERRVSPVPGVVVHRSCRVGRARHPSRMPPRTRIEETVVDLVDTSACLEQALGWIARACSRRLTRPERIAETVATRTRVRWRGELLAALSDVANGAHSSLELRYLRDVERVHRLPTGSRQYTVVRSGGRFYDDVRYPDFGVTVELDGRAAHADEVRWRDMRRDNASVVAGRRVLRYGWADVAGRPCEVAAQVAAVLGAAGWRGAPRPCRRGCAASQ